MSEAQDLRLDALDVHLGSFSGSPIQDSDENGESFTVGNYFKKMKLTPVRIYLHTELHKIDSARKYVIVDRPDQLDDNIPVSSKLQMDKVQYFISFFSRPQFIQDVEFGDIILKLTTGQIIHIPDVVRTLIGSRIISTYLAYCAEVSFEALKRSRLYHILKQCSASQRKSLCG
uniref:Uncharacterized protein n=1 Tax=Magallana gigas TaxID=29159 RepID=A0A8W8MLP4_MAGGI